VSWWKVAGAPTLGAQMASRRNGLGFIRLVLALTVLVAHAWTIGFAWPGLGALGVGTSGQANSLAIYGFFIISGFLITASGMKSGPATFAWRRFLRIFPGFWMCLIVTAFVLAPLASWREGRGLGAVWQATPGPVSYVWTNWFTSMDQFGIGSLLTGLPYGRASGGSVFDGSLWSLKYELTCYLVIGVLAVTGVLSRQRRVVVGLTAVFYATIVVGFVLTVSTMPRPVFPGAVGPFPLVGSFNVNQSVYLGFVFLLGALLRLYQDRIPMSGVLAALSAVVVVVSLWWEGFVVVGVPAYGYLLFYVAVAMPRRLQQVGRKRDYSYGVFLYAFPVEQMVTLFGGARWGLIAFIAISTAISLALAALSWHLVERPAMSLKNRTVRVPVWLRQRRPRAEQTAAVEDSRQDERTGV
jgi:peptidoglycan/LPS O-acetylase OafA/YrhL